MVKSFESPNKKILAFSVQQDILGGKRFHEEPDFLFFVTKGLQEISAQLQVRSSLTYLDIYHFMIVPLRKTIVRKKWSRTTKFYQIKLLFLTTSLPYSLCTLITNVFIVSKLLFRTS